MIPMDLRQKLVAKLKVNHGRIAQSIPLRSSVVVSPMVSPVTPPPSPPSPLPTLEARYKDESIATLCVLLETLRLSWPSDPQASYAFDVGTNAFATAKISHINWGAAYDKALEMSGSLTANGPFSITDWFVNLIAAEYHAPGSYTIELQLLLDAQACKLDTTIDISGVYAIEVIRDDKLFSNDFDAFYNFISNEMKLRKRFIVLTANARKLQLRFTNLTNQVKNPW